MPASRWAKPQTFLLLVVLSITSLLVALYKFNISWQNVRSQWYSINRDYIFVGPLAQDKVVVLGTISAEDVSWVEAELPEWKHAIYYMDDAIKGVLHLSLNKGREAMAYLTFIVDHYHNLPSVMAFVHAHRSGWPAAWHTDAQDNDIVRALRNLNVEYVQQEGYANLRCICKPGCPDEIQPFRQPYQEDQIAEHAMLEVYLHLFGGNITTVPRVFAQPCCSQFAVSSNQITIRPRSDYQKYQRWLIETELDDATSGRVME